MDDSDRSLAELRRHLQRLTVLHQVQTRIAAALDPDTVLANVLDSLDQLVTYETAAVYLLELHEAGPPRLRAERTFAADSVQAKPGALAPADGPVPQALAADHTVAPRLGDGSAALVVLLRAGGRVLGALELRLAEPLPPDQVTIVELLAAGVSIALQNARLYQETQQLATTDGLTGLSTRRAFDTQLDLEVQRARRLGYSIGLIMMDLDDFKRLNDRHGHAVGDETLRRLGKLLKARLRRTDVVGRLGGEEFGAVLPGALLPDVGLVAEALRRAVAQLPPATGGLSDVQTAVTLSLGGAATPATRAAAADLLARADEALYQAKHNGGNQVRLWQGSDR